MWLEARHNWITFREAANTHLGMLMLEGFVLVVDWLPPPFSRRDYHSLACTGGPLSRLITALEGTVTHSFRDVLSRNRLFLEIKLKPKKSNFISLLLWTISKSFFNTVFISLLPYCFYSTSFLSCLSHAWCFHHRPLSPTEATWTVPYLGFSVVPGISSIAFFSPVHLPLILFPVLVSCPVQ